MSYLVLVLLLLLATTARISAVTYQVVNNAANTPGGARFNSQIGSSYAQHALCSATGFIWRILQESNPSTRTPNINNIPLFVDNMAGVAYTSNNEIHLSAGYVGGYSGDVRKEVTGVLFHEMAHVWQWNGNGLTPSGLIEGVADFVRLKAGYGPAHWVKPGQGDRWDQGYDVTAQFLDYCESLRSGFVAQLNSKMRYGYNVGFFNDLLGKSVDQLWADYKAKFGKGSH